MEKIQTKKFIIIISLLLSFGLLIGGITSVNAATKPKKVTGVKATTSTTSITLSWKKAKRAKKYEIYQGSKLIKTQKKTRYTVKNLKANTTYKFKIRGINGSKKGSFSKVKSVKTDKPTNKTERNFSFYFSNGKNGRNDLKISLEKNYNNYCNWNTNGKVYSRKLKKGHYSLRAKKNGSTLCVVEFKVNSSLNINVTDFRSLMDDGIAEYSIASSGSRLNVKLITEEEEEQQRISTAKTFNISCLTESNSVLEGVDIKLHNSDYDLVGSWQTGKSAKSIKLPADTYSISTYYNEKEMYIKSFNFTVDSKGSILYYSSDLMRVSGQNIYLLSGVKGSNSQSQVKRDYKLYVLDSKGNNLSGTMLKLKNSDWDTIYNGTSSNTGIQLKLVADEYELNVNHNYGDFYSNIEFEIDNNGSIINYDSSELRINGNNIYVLTDI